MAGSALVWFRGATLKTKKNLVLDDHLSLMFSVIVDVDK